MNCSNQGGVTPIDSIVTSVTAVSQCSTVTLPKWVQSTIKAAQKYSGEQTQIIVLQFAPNWNGLMWVGVTHATK